MPARRFFVEEIHREGEVVPISGTDAHKIANVLRLRSGDRVEIVDSAGTLFDAELQVEDGDVRAQLAQGRTRSDSAIVIDVAQGLPKGSKMDFVVEKLTELGVNAIIPFESERSVVREPGAAKIERWRRLARAAAQQSGRLDVTNVHEALTFADLSETFPNYDVVLFPWEAAPQEPLRDILPGLIESARRVLVVIGPEGGLSHREADQSTSAGAHLISLGSRILRTETAAMMVASILRYLTDRSRT